MIYKFFRDENLKVRNIVTGKASAEYKIKKLIEQGESVVYRHKTTGIDLLPRLLSQIEKESQGPISPQFGDKLRICNHCGNGTVNYFKCSECWSLVEQEEI